MLSESEKSDKSGFQWYHPLQPDPKREAELSYSLRSHRSFLTGQSLSAVGEQCRVSLLRPQGPFPG